MKKPVLTPFQTMCLIGFSYIASSSVIAPILSIYVKDVLKGSIGAVGIVTAVFFLVSALSKLFLGVFAGGKKTISFLFLFFVVFTVCSALYPLAENPNMLAVLRIFQGLSYAFIGTASLILAAITVSARERDKAIGFYSFSLALGFVAGPAITTLSIPFFGIRNTFYFAAILGLIGVFGSYVLYREISGVEDVWQVLRIRVEREPLKMKISKIFVNRMFLTAFLGAFSFYFIFGFLLAYAPIYVKDYLNSSDEYVSILFLLYYIATTLTRLQSGKLTEKISKTKLMVLTTFFTAILLLFSTIFRNILVFSLIFALLGASQGIVFPVGSMLIAEGIHPSRNILANSLYMMILDVGQGIAPLMMAIVALKYGLTFAFIATAVVPIMTVVLLSVINLK